MHLEHKRLIQFFVPSFIFLIVMNPSVSQEIGVDYDTLRGEENIPI